MENPKRYIEIRIDMDEGRSRVGLTAHASVKDLLDGYVAAAKNIAQSIANRSDATVSETLCAMAIALLTRGAEAYEEEGD